MHPTCSTTVATQPPASPPSPPRPTTGAPALWALGLALAAVVAAAALALALLTGPRPGPVSPSIYELALLGVPAIALAGFVLGIVSTVRAARRGEKVWMPVAALVVGAAMLVVWPGVFIALMVSLALSSLS